MAHGMARTLSQSPQVTSSYLAKTDIVGTFARTLIQIWFSRIGSDH